MELKKHFTKAIWMRHLNTFASLSPLGAALIAPMATLYDLPALTQRWYALNGVEQPDPTASLVLSGFTLALSLLANILLVVRFTVHFKPMIWQAVIIGSTAGWCLKTCIGVANLITFGALTRNSPGYEYIQGFWCAVLSVICSGTAAIMLIVHLVMRRNAEPDANIKFEGRLFILSEVTLFGTMALEALIFSQIEGWSYTDGLYFSVVAILTIGFGDFEPTHTSTKILLFPFAIAGFALLSNQISLIVGAVSTRVEQRRQKFYLSSIASFEKFVEDRKHAKGQGHVNRSPSQQGALRMEIHRLRRVAQERQDLEQLTDLAYSAAALVVFWLIGAVIYHYMEGWSMGNSLYFNYVFFLTIGFGDYSPATPAGRVTFILWALLDVPIMTSFVVQTVQTIVERLSKWLAFSAREKRLERESIEEKYFVPHDDYVENDEWWDHLDGTKKSIELIGRRRPSKDQSQNGDTEEVQAEKAAVEVDQQEEQVDDVEKAIDHRHQENADDRNREWRSDARKQASRTDSSSSSSRSSNLRRRSGSGATEAGKSADRKVRDYARQGSAVQRGNTRQDDEDASTPTSELDGDQGGNDERSGRRRQRRDDEEGRSAREVSAATNGTTDSHANDEEREEAIERILSLSTYLEAQARSLLIESFKLGSPERLLLQADANVQTARLVEWGEELPPWMDGLKESLENDSVLDRVKKYRITYARLLVNGSKVLQLEGERAKAWERRRVVLMGKEEEEKKKKQQRKKAPSGSSSDDADADVEADADAEGVPDAEEDPDSARAQEDREKKAAAMLEGNMLKAF